MFDFKEIEAFVWIVRLGSFRLAARHLHLTQPSVSDRIARLESIVGEPLLERTQRPIKPTIKGRNFLHYAEQLLTSREQAMSVINPDHPYQGSIRLGIVESLAYSWLPLFMNEVRQRFPGISIECDIDVTPQLSAKLLAHEIDMAFLIGPINDDQLVNRLLCHYPNVLIAQPGLVPDPDRCRIEDIADYPFISPARSSPAYRTVREFLIENGLQDATLHCSSSLAMIIKMAHDGVGIGAISLCMAEQAIRKGDVVVLPFALKGHDFTASWARHGNHVLADELTQMAARISSSIENERFSR